MTTAPSRRQRRGSARGLRFGDPRRPEVQLARRREAEVIELRRQGLNFPEIAERVGLTRQGAWEVLARIRRRHPTSAAIVVEELTLDACRLDRMLRAVMPAAVAGRPGHVHAAVSLIVMKRGIVEALQAAMGAETARTTRR